MDAQLAKALIYEEDHPDYDHYEEVSPSQVVGTGRWQIAYEAVYRDVRDDSFWCVSWDEGATEYQESSGDVYVSRVYPHQVVRTEYKSTPQVVA